MPFVTNDVFMLVSYMMFDNVSSVVSVILSVIPILHESCISVDSVNSLYHLLSVDSVLLEFGGQCVFCGFLPDMDSAPCVDIASSVV